MTYRKSRACETAVLVSCLLAGGTMFAGDKPAPAATAPTPAAKVDSGKKAAPPPAPVVVPVKVAPAVAVAADGPKFPVSQVSVSYATQHPAQPTIASAMDVVVAFGQVADGLVVPRKELPTVTVKLSALSGKADKPIYASGLKAISQSLVEHFTKTGLIGVYVTPSKEDLDLNELQDLRAEGNTKLRFVVHTSVVKSVRTLASGDRIPSEQRINNPAHSRIMANSPLQPAAVDGKGPRNDLMRQDELNDYVNRLNRHPGRRVDVAVSSGAAPGEATLDYLVTENKPWTAYAQVMNTGTAGTGDFRERFGFTHNQLTGHDDILNLEYVTSAFDTSNSGNLSYEIPVLGIDRLRLRPYVSYSEYTASDVGARAQAFKGDSLTLGMEAIGNIVQYRKFFLDWVAGVRWQQSHVELTEIGGIPLSDQTGDAEFFLPYAGLRLERNSDVARTAGSLTLEQNLPGVFGTPRGTDLDKMGRANADREWVALKWNIEQSIYLESLFRMQQNQAAQKMAHEMWFNYRGQRILGDQRLPPQFEDVAGGFFTVRGYPESVAAGDNVQLASAEYRLHLPRLFNDSVETRPVPGLGRPFKVATKGGSNPDWDLILRPFLDYAQVNSNSPMEYEKPQTLMSTGVGLEWQLLRNFSIRCDWGHTLRDVTTSDSEIIGKGHDRLHLMATLLW